MNRIAKMISAEFCVAVMLGVLAASGITRPSARIQPVQVVVIGKAQVPSVQATIYSATWCGPCKSYEKNVTTEMPPDGWSVKQDTDKDSATAHVVITKNEADWKRLKIDSVPTTIIRKAGKEVKRFTGKITPDTLANAINDAAK